MNLLTMNQMSEANIMEIINSALEFKKGKVVDYNFKKIVCSLFFEPSTRTQYSFEVAAKRLNCQTITFNPETSSTQKGETFYDTIKTFESFDVDAMVIRHGIDSYFDQIDNVKCPIVNGGDGSSHHPTQSLLDLMTIYEEFNTFEGLNVLICGDIKHSRVAGSNYEAMTKLGMNVSFSAPMELRGNYGEYVDIDETINKYDVIMLLRVQLERHDGDITVDNYNQKYGMNIKRINKMKTGGIIMHPAPFNIDVELTREVVDHKVSRILAQSNNGVYIRMAVLDNVL